MFEFRRLIIASHDLLAAVANRQQNFDGSRIDTRREEETVSSTQLLKEEGAFYNFETANVVAESLPIIEVIATFQPQEVYPNSGIQTLCHSFSPIFIHKS